MYVERANGTLKYKFLKGKKNRRLDALLQFSQSLRYECVVRTLCTTGVEFVPASCYCFAMYLIDSELHVCVLGFAKFGPAHGRPTARPTPWAGPGRAHRDGAWAGPGRGPRFWGKGRAGPSNLGPQAHVNQSVSHSSLASNSWLCVYVYI